MRFIISYRITLGSPPYGLRTAVARRRRLPSERLRRLFKKRSKLGDFVMLPLHLQQHSPVGHLLAYSIDPAPKQVLRHALVAFPNVGLNLGAIISIGSLSPRHELVASIETKHFDRIDRSSGVETFVQAVRAKVKRKNKSSRRRRSGSSLRGLISIAVPCAGGVLGWGTASRPRGGASLMNCRGACTDRQETIPKLSPLNPGPLHVAQAKRKFGQRNVSSG